MSQGVPIPEMRVGESLDSFHDRCVEVPSEETRQKNAAMDTFVRFLQQAMRRSEFSVSEVHKSGSVGKGTAVKQSADIDLVVYFNGINQINKLKEKRPELLRELKQKVEEYSEWKERIQRKKKTSYSLSYTLDGEDLDILPAFNILGSVQGQPAVIYNQLAQYSAGSSEGAQQYSASLAPLQIAFVKTQPDTVKRVIRLVKYWSKKKDLKIRSYTLELITIFASRERPVSSTGPLFKRVMELLRNCPNLRVAFNDNYPSEKYVGNLKAPYVLDPANPFMNTLDGAEIRRISEEAKASLAFL